MKLKLILFSLALLFTIHGFSIPPNELGKTIFVSRCGSCHNVNKIIVGPALAGVDERRSTEWIIKFIHSPQTMIKSGDKDAQALFAKFNMVMPDHPDLKVDDIKNILAYIKSESSKEPKDNVSAFRPEKLHPAYLPISLSSYGFFVTFLIGITVLIASLLFFVRVKEYERDHKAL